MVYSIFSLRVDGSWKYVNNGLFFNVYLLLGSGAEVKLDDYSGSKTVEDQYGS